MLVRKSFLFVAVCAMNIALADEFGGLDYYEESIPKPQISNTTFQSNVLMARVPLPRGCTSFTNLNS